mgnify:CR=1 FL=1
MAKVPGLRMTRYSWAVVAAFMLVQVPFATAALNQCCSFLGVCGGGCCCKEEVINGLLYRKCADTSANFYSKCVSKPESSLQCTNTNYSCWSQFQCTVHVGLASGDQYCNAPTQEDENCSCQVTDRCSTPYDNCP